MPVIDDYQELLDSPLQTSLTLVDHTAAQLQQPASLSVLLVTIAGLIWMLPEQHGYQAQQKAQLVVQYRYLCNSWLTV